MASIRPDGQLRSIPISDQMAHSLPPPCQTGWLTPFHPHIRLDGWLWSISMILNIIIVTNDMACGMCTQKNYRIRGEDSMTWSNLVDPYIIRCKITWRLHILHTLFMAFATVNYMAMTKMAFEHDIHVSYTIRPYFPRRILSMPCVIILFVLRCIIKDWPRYRKYSNR